MPNTAAAGRKILFIKRITCAHLFYMWVSPHPLKGKYAFTFMNKTLVLFCILRLAPSGSSARLHLSATIVMMCY